MDKADDDKRQFSDAWAMYVDVRRDEFSVEAPLLVRNLLEISSAGCASVRVQAARREEVRSVTSGGGTFALALTMSFLLSLSLFRLRKRC
jgi:hypothetical protein